MKTRRKAVHRRRAFTLIEATIAISLMAIIMAAVMDFFIVMSRTTVAASASMFASADSNTAMTHIISVTREAKWIALPDDSSTAFAPLGTYGLSDYSTTYNGYSIDTGIEITFPAAGTNPTVALSSGTVGLPIYDRGTDGSKLWIYRSNSNGTPNPTTGTYLWEYGTDAGNAVNKPLIRSVATATNAVQFVRPQVGTTVQTYQVEVKIISSYYSPIDGVNTNEASNGHSTTALTGKCVLMRDHELTNAHDPTTGTSNMGPHWSPF